MIGMRARRVIANGAGARSSAGTDQMRFVALQTRGQGTLCYTAGDILALSAFFVENDELPFPEHFPGSGNVRLSGIDHGRTPYD
jgi:hypothetical protein